MPKQYYQLAALLYCLNLSGCAVWETITFSKETNSEIETKQKQVLDFQYIFDSTSANNLLDSLPETFKKEEKDFGIALNNCYEGEVNPAAILVPVVAKFLVDSALDAVANYAEDLQDRGVKRYSVTLVVSDPKAISKGILKKLEEQKYKSKGKQKTPVDRAPQENSNRGCLVIIRKGLDNKVGMAVVIQLVAYNKIMQFVPTHIKFDNFMALTREGNENATGNADVNFTIVVSASRAINLGTGNKKVELGVASFDINRVNLGTTVVRCAVSDKLNRCPVATKTIDQADETAQDVEFSVSVTEMGSHVKDAKKAQEKFKSLKETIGPKVEDFLKDQLKDDTK